MTRSDVATLSRPSPVLLISDDGHEDYIADALLDIASRAPISYGDFQLYGFGADDAPGLVVGDVKRIVDLAHCVVTGHHMAQVQRARDAGAVEVYAVVEINTWNVREGEDGMIETRTSSRTPWSRVEPPVEYWRVWDYVEQLDTVCGVRVRRSSGRNDTPRVVKAIWRYHRVPPSEHTSTKVEWRVAPAVVPGTWSYSRPSLLYRVASEFEGVGRARALAIADEFGNVVDFVRKSPTQLERVDGIGGELARSIWSQARGGRKWSGGGDGRAAERENE